MAEVEEAIQFLEREIPGYSRNLRGSPPQQVERLEAKVGSPLPSVYRDYLLRMGEDAGGIDLFHRAPSTLAFLLLYYNEARGGPFTCPPRNCMTIAFHGQIIPEAYLTLNEAPDPPVYYGESGEIDGLFSESFSKRLMQSAFEHVATLPDRHLAHVAPLPLKSGPSTVSIDQLNNTLKKMGMALRDFSDINRSCASNGYVDVLCEQLPQFHDGRVLVSSHSRESLGEVVASLKLHFGLRQEWLRPAQ